MAATVSKVLPKVSTTSAPLVVGVKRYQTVLVVVTLKPAQARAVCPGAPGSPGSVVALLAAAVAVAGSEPGATTAAAAKLSFAGGGVVVAAFRTRLPKAPRKPPTWMR